MHHFRRGCFRRLGLSDRGSVVVIWPPAAITRQGCRIMTVAIIIPARYSSLRLPGKPLLRETGKYLIQHVYERACAAGCGAEVIVATDDDRILNAVRSFGGRAEMT